MSEPLAVDLMNTVWADRTGVHDALDGLDAAQVWVDGVVGRLPVPGLSPRLRPADLTPLVALRDALRALAALTTQDERPSARGCVTPTVAIQVLADLAAAAPSYSTVEVAADGAFTSVRRSVAPPTAAMLALIAEDGVELLTRDAEDLRACGGPGCVLYFVRTGKRRWCSDDCGNRARVARHYARHRDPGLR